MPSRDLIADAVEMTHEAYMSDALLAFCGCDKTIPAVLLAFARLNARGVVVYGGTALPPASAGAAARYEDVGEATGAFSAGDLSVSELSTIEKEFRVGSGSCAGFFTANTMAAMAEALGLALPGSGTGPAIEKIKNHARPNGPRCGSVNAPVAAEKLEDVRKAVLRVKQMLMSDGPRSQALPHDILTREAFENAVTVLFAMGGSTNAVLHLLALANEVEKNSSTSLGGKKLLDIGDIARIGKVVPLIANLSPRGPYWVSELHAVGGVPMVMKALLKESFLHGECRTVTGRTVAENLSRVEFEGTTRCNSKVRREYYPMLIHEMKDRGMTP